MAAARGPGSFCVEERAPAQRREVMASWSLRLARLEPIKVWRARDSRDSWRLVVEIGAVFEEGYPGIDDPTDGLVGLNASGGR
jgi:hypothetical protein